MRLVITGSSTGIGRALAEDRLRRGDDVWGLARSDQSDLVIRYPQRFRFSRVDVSDWNAVSAAAGEVRAVWAGFHGLICCAGRQGQGSPALASDPAEWVATLRANLEGTFHTLRAYAPLLDVRAGRAKIICFSGGGATQARPRFSAYGVAKTGIVRLVETIAAELVHEPIDINAIAPGAIATAMTRQIIEQGADAAGAAEVEAARRTLGIDPTVSLEKVLGLAAWLLSPRSDGFNGRLISAALDPWPDFVHDLPGLKTSENYTLRRITPPPRH